MSPTANITRAKRGDITPFTNALARWDGKYTQAAIDRVIEVMLNDWQTEDRGDGSDRIRPSSIYGPCPRAKMLSYRGERSADSTQSMQRMAHGGTWSHYKWQLFGLSCGILEDVEVTVTYAPWYVSGNIDGALFEGTGFDLKTVDGFNYPKITAARNEETGELEIRPRMKDLWQAHGYMKAMGTKWFYLIYENRSTLDFTEVRIEWSDVIGDQLATEMEYLSEHIEGDTLPAILHGCTLQRGNVYTKCLWKKPCFLEG